MEDLCRDLLHKAACGFLVQGHVHNMSGPLQILSMQMELMRTFMDQLVDNVSPEHSKMLETLLKKLAQASSQIERLRSLLGALSEVTEEAPTVLDLNELLRQELVFWEGDLVFKHEVEKELHFAEEPLSFYASPRALNQGLCAFFWSFVPALSRAKGRLRVTTEAEEEGPKATFSLTGAEIPLESPFLEMAHELLGEYASLDVKPNLAVLRCRKKGV